MASSWTPWMIPLQAYQLEMLSACNVLQPSSPFGTLSGHRASAGGNNKGLETLGAGPRLGPGHPHKDCCG